MLETIFQFVLKYKLIIIFYLIVIIFLIIKRNKLDVQAKFIFLYRMKWGLKWMNKYSKKYQEWIVLLGYIGVGAGFVGLVIISYVLIKNLYDLISNPAATSGVSLVLPGVNIPGLGVLPFWYWLIAIFIIAIVHEFAHGIVARAHQIKVKNTGIVLLGPIIGAFVEPDENHLKKQKDIAQYSVLAAGAFSNILLAIVAVLLLTFIFTPIQQSMVEPQGFTFDAYVGEDFPVAQAGIPTGTIITSINNQPTKDFQEFSQHLLCKKSGEKISLSSSENNYSLILTANPDDSTKPFLGIEGIRNEFEIKEKYQEGVWHSVYYVVDWTNGFLRWLFILSLGIGLFNLLPLPIVDGGRMAQVFLHRLKGEQKGEKRYRQISMLFLLILLLNLFFPFLAKLF